MGAASPPVIDRVVDGRYRVGSYLARGGMASVYRATDLRLDRDVALKVMHPDLARDPDFADRFEREARAAARLSHPHVVSVHDQGVDGDLVFLAMELVEGRTLRDVIAEQGPQSVRAALRWFDPVLQALAAAHDAGLVHRDVKPENVLISRAGAVKVADFGLARAVGTSTMSRSSDLAWGTAAYLAPEQVETGRADARSDVYAAGLLLYELLTGEKAYPGDSALQVAYQHVHGAVPRAAEVVPTVPAELDRLVQWAAARDPADRPADARELLAALRHHVALLSEEELDPLPGTGADQTQPVPLADPELTARFSPTRPWQEQLPSAPAAPAGEGGYARTTGNRAPRAGRAPAAAPPRRRRAGGWVLGLLLLLLALAGAGTTWYFTDGPGVHSPVPELAGLIREDAEAALEAQDLDPAVTEEHSETVPAGTVVSASHDPGEEVRHGTDVDLVVSLGPERYAVPQLVGLTEDAAAAALEDSNLAVGEVSAEHSEDVPEGEVLSASEEVGTPLRRDAPVDLVLSSGPEPIAIPSVVGEELAQASQTLSEAGFTVVDTERAHHDDIPEGSVVSQSPSDGSGHRGDRVELVVSLGPQLVEVPAMIGMQYDQAESMLRDMGLAVVREDLAGGYFGTVRFQSVDPGEQVPRGTEVTLTVL